MPFKPPSHNHARAQQTRQQHDRQRGSARDRGYSAAWDNESKAFLLDNPLCAECKRAGKTRIAKVTDHIKPARYFPELFWIKSNWQPLCARHNTAKAARDERLYSHLRPQGGSKI